MFRRGPPVKVVTEYRHLSSEIVDAPVVIVCADDRDAVDSIERIRIAASSSAGKTLWYMVGERKLLELLAKRLNIGVDERVFFVDADSGELFEKYVVGGECVSNELGKFEVALANGSTTVGLTFRAQGALENFLRRRADFRGIELTGMTGGQVNLCIIISSIGGRPYMIPYDPPTHTRAKSHHHRWAWGQKLAGGGGGGWFFDPPGGNKLYPSGGEGGEIIDKKANSFVAVKGNKKYSGFLPKSSHFSAACDSKSVRGETVVPVPTYDIKCLEFLGNFYLTLFRCHI